MKKHALDTKSIISHALNTGRIHAQADALAADKQAGDRIVQVIALAAIKPRESDTRKARAEHALSLAENIAAVGLLQAPIVDAEKVLVGGLHRITALRLLLAHRDDREAMLAELDGNAADAVERLAELPASDSLPEPLRSGRVPVLLLATGADALAAEIAENTARRAYSLGEIKTLVGKLTAAGYHATRGRPKAGQKALKPALEVILGVSGATVKRLLATGKMDQMSHLTPKQKAKAKREKAAKKLIKALKDYDAIAPDSTDWQQLHAALITYLTH
jgi:ParB family chromosome partitioning protein